MRLHKFSVLAAGLGLCNGEQEQAAHIPKLRRERIQNVSSIAYSLASATGTSLSNSLYGTAASPRVHFSSPIGLPGSRNSSTTKRPIGTGASIGTAVIPQHSANGSCGQPTVNILDASLDYLYTSTIYNAVSTFSIQLNSEESPTGWTLLPASTTFDLSSALEGQTPIAAKTTIITQTAYRSPDATTGEGQIPNVIVTPPPASITASSYSTTLSTDTAVIHFDKYEVVSQTPQPYNFGPHACATVTKTYTLETPSAFPYNGETRNLSGAFTTGDVHSVVLGSLGKNFAVAGSWKAAPTVAIVVQNVFAAEAVKAASIEASEKTLLTPKATLPSFLSPVHPKTTQDQLPNGNPKGHTETTQKFLLVPTPTPTPTKDGGGDGHDNGNGGGNSPRTTSPGGEPQGGGPKIVPFVAHLENSDTTLLVPSPGSADVITTIIDGVTVTATRTSQGDERGNDGSGGNGGEGQVTLDAFHGTPTNAVQVLSEALASFKSDAKGSKETAAAGSSPQTVPVIVVGQTSFTADSKTVFKLPGSETLTPGGTAQIHGTSLSLAAGGSSIVINGHTEPVASAVITPAPALTIGGHVFHATSGSTYIIQGQTLTPGGVISVKGTFVSLGPGLSTVVINGKTHDIANGSPKPTSAITSPPVLTIGGKTYSAVNSNGATYVINGKTLTPGDEETVTIHGKTYIVSLAPGATVLRIETVGANGEVTATMFETLYLAGSQATQTSIVGAGGASAASRHSASTSAKATGPHASLQNAASSYSKLSGPIGIALASFVLAVWL